MQAGEGVERGSRTAVPWASAKPEFKMAASTSLGRQGGKHQEGKDAWGADWGSELALVFWRPSCGSVNGRLSSV